MWFLWLASWVSFILQITFATVSLAAGLFYLAELVEEYTSYAALLIRYCILTCTLFSIGFLVFASFDLVLIAVALGCQLCHFALMSNFPMFQLTSPKFILACVLNVVHHYLAFQFFGSHPHTFHEVISYFVLCCWVVPLLLLVSLSANDNTLPTHGNAYQSMEGAPLLYGSTGNGDYVSNYISNRSKSKISGSSFKTMLQSLKESVFPASNKRLA